MAILIGINYKARVTELRSFEPPENWDRMSESERLAWLDRNPFVGGRPSLEIEDVEDRKILEYPFQ